MVVATREPPSNFGAGVLLRVQRIYRPIWRAVNQWIDADGMRMSAAMSFYGVLSLAPLLVLLVAVLGWWLDKNYLETNLIGQIRSVIGQQGAQLLQQAITSAQKPSEGVVASVVAFGLLLSGATGVFTELQDAFERLWRQGSAEVPKQKWWRGASLRLRGVAYILAFGLLLLMSLAISTFLNMLSGWAGNYIALEWIGFVINEMVSFSISVALFVALMRMSKGPKPGLRYLVRGAAVGAVLFAVGKHLMAYYLSTAAAVSAYGAAGALVIILMWIYFTSGVLLFSASVARAWRDQSLSRRAIDAATPTASTAPAGKVKGSA
ncbi:MAG: ribonuclease BN [Polaromonas sp. 39-63-203]|jgi:membrane protein|uniref:YihY/virulence factor BrkB family protein n=1 Tax=Polaromonas sp. TaxID=1869339 RepID=UPI000BDCF326|nr:YihY/virulence factor BrkB family protein [Polaromonas sp.]OYY51734.1 MAG: ribonuclease BN [Polaromonas sp. 35-63-240]OYY97482.1 MAG: ribonuclease BN [Polaromonas sp. 28-63-22]OYZ83327.1 MAG: ribonuclease BN [Polaromonas sp. 24-62-144]OZA96646.1 MAG: ribonuclease BN [Polaromonas sp. 39-63-203]HQS33462.1 YihY/virulence factor BrkB family protein [Polaromonas sp.]